MQMPYGYPPAAYGMHPNAQAGYGYPPQAAAGGYGGYPNYSGGAPGYGAAPGTGAGKGFQVCV